MSCYPLQWSPLERGFLARPPTTEVTTVRSETYLKQNKLSEADLEIIGRVEKVAKDRGWNMTEVALAWVNKRSTSPIIGFSSVERIDQALAVNGKVLTEEEEKYLEEPYKAKSVIGHS